MFSVIYKLIRSNVSRTGVRSALALAIAAGLLPCVATVTNAQTAPVANPAMLPRPVLPLHPWQSPQVSGKGAEAYFANLKNGDTIETPFLLKFGLSGGWGLAPISKPMGGKSGHHHLLVNRDLPLDFKKALPFDDQYIHFGKGQMEKVLTLAPGTYTLRMLLADDQHLPRFVYSEPIKITVARKNDTKPEALVKKGVSMGVEELVSDTNADVLKGAFRVQMHASGLNVGHQAQLEAGTGHFKLAFFPKSAPAGTKGKPVAEMEFINGETEVWLAPPDGEYLMKLDLIDNTRPDTPMTEPAILPIRVKNRS